MIEVSAWGAGGTRRVAAAVASVLRPGDVVVLSGSLGAGKTTFAQGALAALGVQGPVTSPTFAIVQEYRGRIPVIHADLYRLDRLQEVYDLGFEEVLQDGAVTFIEWGERISQLLPADHLVVELVTVDDPGRRLVRIRPHGQAWRPRRAQLQEVLGAVGRAG